MLIPRCVLSRFSTTDVSSLSQSPLISSSFSGNVSGPDKEEDEKGADLSEKVNAVLLCCSKCGCLCLAPIICVNGYVVMQEEKTEGRGRRKRKLSSQRAPAVKESGNLSELNLSPFVTDFKTLMF